MVRRLDELNNGISLTTTQEESDLSNGIYRIVSGGSDVTVATKIEGGTFYDIGTVSSGESKDLYLTQDTILRCTFSGAATLQRLQGAS
jgi:hypothetical protein